LRTHRRAGGKIPPASYLQKPLLRHGGLISYATDTAEIYRQAIPRDEKTDRFTCVRSGHSRREESCPERNNSGGSDVYDHTFLTGGIVHVPSMIEGAFSSGQYMRSIRINLPAGDGSQFDSLSVPGESFWM
jgi:hypothetical protein